MSSKLISLAPLFFAVSLLASCGSKGGNGRNNQPSDEDIIARNTEGFSLALAANTGTLKNDSAGILWSATVSVKSADGQSNVAKQSRVPLATLMQELAKVKIHLSDAIDFKLTAESVTPEKADVLATNVETDAFRTDLTKSMWNAQCKEMSNNALQIDLSGLRSGKYKLGSDGKSIQLSLRLCDFANLLVTPVVEVKPQAAIEFHNVTFRCVANASDPNYYVAKLDKPTCRYGYRSENGNSAPFENVVPTGTDLTKEFKPEISSRLSNELGRQQYDLSVSFSDISQLPYFARKDAGCQGMEVVLYEFANPTKEYRVKYKFNGSKWIVEDDLGQRPKVTGPSTMEFFLHCYWRTEVSAGNTISIPFSN